MITLDGVMQAPGGPAEDPSGGFNYGGWIAPFSDDIYNKVVLDELKPASYLLGRKTFEIWAAYWPQNAKNWPGINDGTKYVFSKNLKNSDSIIAGWKNSIVINDIDQIKAIKQEEGMDIQVWGSGKLVQLLLKHDLIDEVRLKIHPLILGKGKKLFDSESIPVAFSLVESVVTTTGVIIAHYKRAGAVETGDLTV